MPSSRRLQFGGLLPSAFLLQPRSLAASHAVSSGYEAEPAPRGHLNKTRPRWLAARPVPGAATLGVPPE
jgi:hypothetical protein